MKPDFLTGIVALLGLIGTAANYVMFLRIRVGQLETRESILREVDDKYVRKDSALLTEHAHGATV